MFKGGWSGAGRGHQKHLEVGTSEQENVRGGRGGRGGQGARGVRGGGSGGPGIAWRKSAPTQESDWHQASQVAAHGNGRMTTASRKPTVQILDRGLVVIRDFLDPETQRFLVDQCFSKKNSALHKGTFWESVNQDNGRTMFRLNMGTR